MVFPDLKIALIVTKSLTPLAEMQHRTLTLWFIDTVLPERSVLSGYKKPKQSSGTRTEPYVWKTANNQIKAFKGLQKAWRTQDHLNHFKKVWDEMKDD